ncbi:MAG: glycine cleavage system protein T [Halobacteriovoraceae bacterium]|nr:glycine cleavage system protein T [Halobacteriovoraceae bacterium]|tara:strand:+ start:21 stop:1079 length:1059 start_codon:yes stop_codon:yes gene_type:complete
MKKTSLFENHVRLGAKMVPYAGFNMPVQYNSVKEEILSVRNKCGMFDVSHMGEFLIEGTDAIKAMDYLIPNDFVNLPIGKAIYSPLLNEQGGIIDDLIAYKLSENKVLVCVNAANIDKDYAWFEKNLNPFNISLRNESNNFSLVALQGPESENHLRKLSFTKDLPLMKSYEVLSFQGLIIAKTGYTGELGFEIFGNHQKITEVWEELSENGVIPCGLAARDTLRLEVCYPLYGQELNENVSPLESNLGWTVKLEKKGDFIGKESLKRATKSTKLVKLKINKGIPRQGSKIIQLNTNEEIGEVTSGTYSPSVGCGIAMARVKNSYKIQDGDLLIEIRSKQYPAEVIKKNFLDS